MATEYIDENLRTRKLLKNKAQLYGVSSPIMEQVASLIDIYKINFVENFEFLLEYTGMTKKQYKKRMESYGLKSPLGTILYIKNRKLLGFDLIYIAQLANMFKLPTSLLLNYNLKNVEGFVPEEYGIHKDMYKNRIAAKNVIDSVSVKASTFSVYKKIHKEKALKKSNYPPGVINLLAYIENGV